MKKLSEGKKMWASVMVIFLAYAAFFIIFEDYDRQFLEPFHEVSDWHLLAFSLVVMTLLGFTLYHYAQSMDERITREQSIRQNEMRRELTQNISHELKTPVASILGYADTILENPGLSEEKRHQFIVRTKVQAQRLAALLQDISTLNRIDYAPDALVKERVDVSELVGDIVDETALSISNKKMTLENCLPEDICVVGNRSLIYSIFRNLIDNSVNYAGAGTTIELFAEEQNDSWLFSFRDNGVGVPEESLPRIFERFYRIDKGRSRETGGTGLGLSIVKNAVLLHGGSITAKCQDKGLRFDFSLKK